MVKPVEVKAPPKTQEAQMIDDLFSDGEEEKPETLAAQTASPTPSFANTQMNEAEAPDPWQAESLPPQPPAVKSKAVGVPEAIGAPATAPIRGEGALARPKATVPFRPDYTDYRQKVEFYWRGDKFPNMLTEMKNGHWCITQLPNTEENRRNWEMLPKQSNDAYAHCYLRAAVDTQTFKTFTEETFKSMAYDNDQYSNKQIFQFQDKAWQPPRIKGKNPFETDEWIIEGDPSYGKSKPERAAAPAPQSGPPPPCPADTQAATDSSSGLQDRTAD